MISKKGLVQGLASMLKSHTGNSTDDAVIDLVANIISDTGACKKCQSYTFLSDRKLCDSCEALKKLEDICE